MKTTITFEIDTDDLSRYSDERIAQLWHIAQANPAPHGNQDAGELAARIGADIVRRWLKTAPVTLYAHQLYDHYWHILKDNGKWIDGVWTPNHELKGEPA